MNSIPYSFVRSAYSTHRPPRPRSTLVHLMYAMRTSFDVVKCLWEVFIWGFGVLSLSCACVVSVSVVLFSVGVCVRVTC